MPDLVCVIFSLAINSRSLTGAGAEQAGRRDVLERQAAARRDLLRTNELTQRVHGGMHDVDRVVRAERLGQHVVHAGALEHGAHGAAGDDAGTGASRLEQHDAGRLLALHRMRDRRRDPRDPEEVLLRLLDALGDRRRHFLRLAVTDADGAVTVADDDQRGEAEPPTALHDLGHPVDGDDPLEMRALLGAAPVAAAVAAVAAVPVAPAAACGRRVGAPRAGPPLRSGHRSASSFGVIQNSNPASRAASAKAAMRPVYVLPPRSKTTREMPADLAASASWAPTWRACAVLSPSDSLYVEAETSVLPCRSSTIWTNRWRAERVTTSRGRSPVPTTFLRSRKCRRARAERRSAATPAERRACLVMVDAPMVTSSLPYRPCGG